MVFILGFFNAILNFNIRQKFLVILYGHAPRDIIKFCHVTGSIHAMITSYRVWWFSAAARGVPFLAQTVVVNLQAMECMFKL